MAKQQDKKNQQKGYSCYLDNIQKPLFQLEEKELREILDTVWYPKANRALDKQRKIWDYSYLAYKGIMTWQEINRKKRANQLGLYVNVPRTFMTIEGIRRNFNISNLKIYLDPIPGMASAKRKTISSFLNYDLKRGGTFDQVKQAGFYKLLYGNGFLYSYLAERKNKYGKITGPIDPETAVVKNVLDTKETTKYFGMVARAVSPYKVFPDPDGTTNDYNDTANPPCEYTCIRSVKNIATFKRDWRGIVPEEILNDIHPGGLDMTNYEAIKETTDFLFDLDMYRYPGSVQDLVGMSKVVKEYDTKEMVEERIWIGEDFFIMQAGAGLKFCIISPNPNPQKISNLVKLDDVSVPGEYWAMGEPYIMRYQQIEENRLHNIALDTLHFGMSSMLGINTQYLEDDSDIDVYPQKVWKLKAMPGVKIDEMMQSFQPSVAGIAPALAFMKEVKQISQSTTSITDFVTGASKSLASTATESNRLSSASDIAIADKIKEMAAGALTQVAKIFLSMYPVAYSDEEMEISSDEMDIKFIGKEKDDIPEEELAKIFEKHLPGNCIFTDEINITEPEFTTTGDISLNRGERLIQWQGAIDYANKINEQAYATGDRRRLDTIKMGLLGLENFDVVSNPDDFMMDGQSIKADEIQLNAELNMQGGNGQANNMPSAPVGAPGKSKISKPMSESSRTNAKAQPGYAGKNQLSKKNQ